MDVNNLIWQAFSFQLRSINKVLEKSEKDQAAEIESLEHDLEELYKNRQDAELQNQNLKLEIDDLKIENEELEDSVRGENFLFALIIHWVISVKILNLSIFNKH